MTEAIIIPTEVKQIYAMNWVIPSIKNRIEDQAARNIQSLWKSQIVGHFARVEYTDGFGYYTEYFAYDRYKNIYRATLTDDRLSINYTKYEDTFESLIFPPGFPEKNLPDYIRFCFNTIAVRHRYQQHISFTFPTWEKELIIEIENDTMSYITRFKEECLERARRYNII